MRETIFAEQGMNEPTGDALYVQPSVQGNSVILSNVYNEETKLNLEVLFNAMLAEREKCNQYLTSKDTDTLWILIISLAFRVLPWS